MTMVFSAPRKRTLSVQSVGLAPISAELSSFLNIGVALADQRKKMGLTQEAIAKKIGSSAPQVSRTERRPEHSNIRTLVRYAAAVGNWSPSDKSRVCAVCRKCDVHPQICPSSANL
jgi:DNA-binding XRE family transcriptional regulator